MGRKMLLMLSRNFFLLLVCCMYVCGVCVCVCVYVCMYVCVHRRNYIFLYT
jgi:hypothetical protein